MKMRFASLPVFFLVLASLVMLLSERTAPAGAQGPQPSITPPAKPTSANPGRQPTPGGTSLQKLPSSGATRSNAGFTANVLARNDDGSTGLVSLGFQAKFFGSTYNQLYVNNNGNVTFDYPQSTYTPYDLTSTNRVIIAPLFADVDTRNSTSGVTTYGIDSVNGHTAFGVNWFNVGYYSYNVDKLNTFQLVLIERSDVSVGDFDIEFNYDQIQWETGDASGGVDGLGGYSARVGYSNGTGNSGTFYESPGSAVPGSFLDTNPFGLIHRAQNSSVLGRYVLQVRNGVPTYYISGRVTDSGGNGIYGVTISDGAGHTTTTDISGNYTLSGLIAGTYTITPSKNNYTFSPSTLIVTVPPRKTGEDFLGAVPQQTTAVPFFSQRDPQWIIHPLRTNGACSADCSTIGACGCTLTSATMIFAYYGSNLTPPGLSDCMGNSACPFAWGTGASCTNGLATYVGQSAFSWSRLDQELNQNHRPVILGTHKSGNPQNTHWVVVVEGQGNNASNYYINDPWFPPPQGGAHIKLSTMAIRNAVFDSLSVYSGQPNPVSPLSATVRLSSNNQNIPTSSQVLTVTGTATIYTMTDVTMTVQLVAQSSAGNITDMMVWTNTTPNNSWQPFASLITMPVSDSVYARFRDEFGNVSDPFSDTTYPVKSPVTPPSPIFLPLIKK